ncbi:hypothetical protein Ancab_026104 [Ancistrocladus abbreviatus]
MGLEIAIPPVPTANINTTTPTKTTPLYHQYSFPRFPNSAPTNYNSSPMTSQDYHQHRHQGIFTFSNGFDRSAMSQQDQQEQQQQSHSHTHHHQQQIRRDKLRVQGFEPMGPQPLVGIDPGEDSPGALHAYETAGMLSEMFNFGAGHGPGSAPELFEHQIPSSGFHRNPPLWYGGRQGSSNSRDSLGQQQQQQQISSMNAGSAAAAMQLFLTNPPPRSPSPPPPPPPPTAASSSTLHMLLPNPSGFHSIGSASSTNPPGLSNSVMTQQSPFTWVPDTSAHDHSGTAGPDIGSIVEGQGLSLSLSSSLQHLETAKAEELRIDIGSDGGMMFFNQAAGGGGGGASSSTNSGHHDSFKNLGTGAGVHHHPYLDNHQLHIGFGSSLGVVNVLRNSKYARPAQELLDEFCSVGRGHFSKTKFNKNNSSSTPSGTTGAAHNGSGGAAGAPSSSTKDAPPLSAADRMEHQRRKVKLLSMLDEVDRRYSHYCEQMQMVVNSFDLVMGFGAAMPYIALAQKAMSRHFRCLKEAIQAQLKHSCELLGEKDAAGSSGITKGETPRLKLLEQSLRQQQAIHQMGLMDQEAWRPQRGLPERSVNALRAWLFEHFLHPYPSDADKHLLARQTGLSRNQVSNWFINARVRLWKPMIEEMYQQESKEAEVRDRERNQSSTNSGSLNNNTNNTNAAQTSTPPPLTPTTTSAAAAAATTPTTSTAAADTTGIRSEIVINALSENDLSHFANINRQSCTPSSFSECQANRHQPPPPYHAPSNPALPPLATDATVSQGFPTDTNRHRLLNASVDRDYGTTSADSIIGPTGAAAAAATLIRFGAGDVSLTLGLRHAGNPQDKGAFSVRDFENC